MIRVATRISSLALLSMSAALAIPAGAKAAETLPLLPNSAAAATPLQLSDGDKARYNAIFAALRDQKWSDAKAMILALDPQDAVRPLALSELYLAKGSPRVELFDLLDLVNKAAWRRSAARPSCPICRRSRSWYGWAQHPAANMSAAARRTSWPRACRPRS